ncbi:MAG: sulfotransferase [Micavibrio sp.]|nr:sulfotransferase [Micavibrio sp.]
MPHTLPIIIHPGFGKTATTTLQNNLFINHPEIECIGRPQGGDAIQFRDNLLRNMDHYDEKKQKEFLQTVMQNSDRRAIVFSDEVFAARIYENQSLANRIKALFPKAKIVFTIRNQYTIIPSYYSNHGRILKKAPRPYRGKQVGFSEWFEYCKTNHTNSYLDFIRYRPIIKIFENLYGRNSIEIFLFEEIVNKNSDFSKKFSDLLGVNTELTLELLKGKKSNPRKSEKMVRYQHFREKFMPGFSFSSFIPGGTRLREDFQNFLNRGKGCSPSITQEHKNFIHQLYKEDNRVLAQDYDLDLKKWGYPL